MEGHSYISCIKINGVPILPPMVCILITQYVVFFIQRVFYSKILSISDDSRYKGRNV